MERHTYTHTLTPSAPPGHCTWVKFVLKEGNDKEDSHTAGLHSTRDGFDLVHGGVEVLDVLGGVEAGRVVVLARHHLGAARRERQGTAVVGRADGLDFLSSCRKMAETKRKIRK